METKSGDVSGSTNDETMTTSHKNLEKGIQFHRDLERSLIASNESYSCIICLESKPHETRTIGPALCECAICLTCVREWLQHSMENEAGLIKCPGCKEGVVADFLDILEYPSEIVLRFLVKQNTSRKRSDPTWYWCPAKDCYGGGKVTEKRSPIQFMTKLVWSWVWSLFGYVKETAKYYTCSQCSWKGCVLCEQDHQPGTFCMKRKRIEHREELEEMLRKGAEPGGKHRPCYVCGSVTERNGGCSIITCIKCGKKWDWNLGKTLCSTWRDEPMQYTPLKKPHLLK